MSSGSTALSRALLATFKTEVGGLASSWDTDSVELRKQLRQRADRVLDKLPGALSDRATRRRATLIFRWLELEGASFPAAYDPVLGCALHQMLDENVRSFGADMLAALSPLPEERQAPLRRALVRSALRVPLSWTTDPVELLVPGLEAEAVEELEAMLAAALQPRSPSTISQPAVLEAITKMRGGFMAEAHVVVLEKLLGRWLGDFDRRAWQNGDTRFEAALALVEPGRLEALLLAAPFGPWEFYALSPTPAILERMASDLARVNGPVRPELAIRGLARMGPEIVPWLAQHLPSTTKERRRLPVHRVIIANGTDEQLSTVLAIYPSVEDAWDRLAIQARLRTAPLEALVSALERAWEAADDTTRPELAEVLAFRAAWEPLDGLIDRLLATEEPEGAVAATLRGARREPAPLEVEVLYLFVGAALPDGCERSERLAELRTAYATLPRLHSYTDMRHLRGRVLAGDDVRRYWTDGGSSKEEAFVRLTRHPQGPTMVWAWICSHSAHYLADTLEIGLQHMGQPAMARTARMLLAAPELPTAAATTLYDWLVTTGEARQDTALHLRMLEQGGKVTQEQAATALSGADEPPIDALVGLLGSGKATTRAAAARALEKLGERARPALPALQTAAKGERAKAAREALQTALTVIDPRVEDPREQRASFGAWSSLEALNARDLMTELRELAGEEAAAIHWMRICDILARLERLGNVEPGIDYVKSHIVGRWPAELAPPPWGWPDHPVFGRLFAPGTLVPIPFVTVATLYGPTRKAWLDAVLPDLERGQRARRFTPVLVDTFLEAVHVAWRFCEEHHIPLHVLDLAADAGAVRRGYISASGTTTRIGLAQGFSVTLSRVTAQREDSPRGPGLRFARVSLPAKHPLRDVHGLKPRQRLLDILPMLGLTENVESVEEEEG